MRRKGRRERGQGDGWEAERFRSRGEKTTVLQEKGEEESRKRVQEKLLMFQEGT